MTATPPPRRPTPQALAPSARAALSDSGLTVADYARQFWTHGVWLGDACGCPDDRCAGFHHDAADDCGCLPVLMQQALDGPAADARQSAEPGPESGRTCL
jgi:hypothetical protein